MHDKRYRIGRLCNNFWGYPSLELTVIGVTGTKGKTTVTYMMKKVLETCVCKTGLIGTIEVDDCS
ncbi:Mur ligase family protein, partial [Coprococcus eutactus]|uniref:Mur ligase family protein n=1 Tax=Coprococcus eutactus TaxID=33043 RepID=UPI00210EDD4F